MTCILRRICALFVFAIAASCGGQSATESGAAAPEELLSADLPELEIRNGGVDRFTTCPPPGELGQHWIPAIPAWTAPPNASADAGAPIADPTFVASTRDYTPTEMASEATHHEFRQCYLKGLIRHPTQDGRVAIVLRVDSAGKVAKVESYGACELAPESIECMYGVAKKLRFPPPANGSDTITIPATFTSRDGVRRTVPTPNDAYTAGAYVTLDAARGQFHACDLSPNKVPATGTFALDIAADGKVKKAAVDQWTGDSSVVKCAAHVLEGLPFPAPSGGNSKVIARLNFNPRQGTR